MADNTLTQEQGQEAGQQQAPEQGMPGQMNLSGDNTPMQNAAQWNIGLAGTLGGLAQQVNNFTPQQRAQLSDMSLQLTQEAANRAMHGQSKMSKIGQILRSVGAAASGVAPGSGQNSFANWAAIQNDARANSQAKDQEIVNLLKLAHQSSQMAGADPKIISQLINGFDKGQRGATGIANAANKQAHNQAMEQIRAASQGTKDFLAKNQVDHWRAQDEESKRNHDMLLQQKYWIRDSINTYENDRLKLAQYNSQIAAGKADAEIKQRAQRLDNELVAKKAAINAGITKFNVHQQFELSKVNGRTGKPVYQDENGNVPQYTPIPAIDEQPQSNEATPLQSFPEMPQMQTAAAPPQALQAEAGSLQAPPQQPNAMAARPLAGAILPSQRGPGMPPPPRNLRDGLVPPPGVKEPTTQQAMAGAKQIPVPHSIQEAVKSVPAGSKHLADAMTAIYQERVRAGYPEAEEMKKMQKALASLQGKK